MGRVDLGAILGQSLVTNRFVIDHPPAAVAVVQIGIAPQPRSDLDVDFGPRIQTRCRDDGAWAQVSRQATRSRLRDGSVPASDLIGTLRCAYHPVLQRNNGHLDFYLT